METEIVTLGELTEREEIFNILSNSIGKKIYLIENNDVRGYTIVANHPSPHLKSVCISYGTNDGCTKWLGEHAAKTKDIFGDYQSAVKCLIGKMEEDLRAVKEIYLK